MIVKIKSCQNKNDWWYRDLIGEMFEVVPVSEQYSRGPEKFYVMDHAGKQKNIAISDVDVVPVSELNFKFKRMLRALRIYGKMDMWHCGFGAPKRGEKYGDGQKYNVFGIFPAQEGWEMAEETLKEIKETGN